MIDLLNFKPIGWFARGAVITIRPDGTYEIEAEMGGLFDAKRDDTEPGGG